MIRPGSASKRSTGPFDLSDTPIHLGSLANAETPAVALPGFGFDGPSFEAYVAEHCAPGAPGRLIMVETTPKNWAAWECHSQGDEIVIVLEGKAEFIQEIDGEERRTPVSPGSTMVNPAGVWHTADVEAPLKAIYITPCPGTQHGDDEDRGEQARKTEESQAIEPACVRHELERQSLIRLQLTGAPQEDESSGS